MKTLKVEREYKEKYGDIPKDKKERFDYLLSTVKSTRSVKGKILSEIKRIRSLKWKSLSYTIWLVPKGTPRPRLSSDGHFYVHGAADNKRLFKEFMKENVNVPLIVTPCKFYVESYLPIPTSMPIYEKILAEIGFIRPVVEPDVDNLFKTYSDMVQGHLIYNDSYIIEGTSKKFYSVKPRIEIRIEYLEDHDSVFNKRKYERTISK